MYLVAVYRHEGAPDEIMLIKRISNHEEKALDALYDRYSKILYSFILSIVKEKEDAEDILQEVVLQVWDKAPAFDVKRGSLYAWLVTIARSRAIDRVRSKDYRNHRQKANDIEMDILPSQEGSTPVEILVNDERAAIVRNALNQIPPDQKEVIQSAYFGGFTQTEIAEKLNLPLGTVKTRMRQGMKKLQVLIGEGV